MADAGQISLEDVRRAIIECEASYWAEERERSERLRAFSQSIPEHMKGTPVVSFMAAIVYTGQPIHPQHARGLQRWYDEEEQKCRPRSTGETT